MLLHVYIRFGKWEEIAAYPMPEDAELYAVSGHLFLWPALRDLPELCSGRRTCVLAALALVASAGSRRSALDAVHLGAPVSELKGCIAAKMGVRAGAQVLTFEGKPLRDEFAVGSYGVRAGSTVHLAYRGRGGGCSHSKGGPAGSAEEVLPGLGRPPASQTQQVSPGSTIANSHTPCKPC